MQHLDEGVIHAWLDDALSTEEAARVAAHAASCAECTAAVAEARGLIAGASRIVSALDVAPAGVVPASSSAGRGGAGATRSLWRRLYLTPSRAAIAATLLLAVGSVLTLRHRPRGSVPLPVGRTVDSPLTVPRRANSALPQRAADSTRRASAPAPAPSVHRVSTARDSAAPASIAAPRRDTLPSLTPVSTQAPIVAAKSMDALVDSGKSAPPAANVVQGEQRSAAAGAATMKVRPQTRFESANLAAPAAAMGRPGAGAGAAGCYSIRPSPGDTTTWLRTLPERFALYPASEYTNAPRIGIVRVASGGAVGELDSVAAGASWRESSPGTVTVAFDAQRAIAVRLTSNPPSAEASSGGVTRAVRVVHSSCPP